MWVLGINAPPAGWHDAAACLVDETGQIFAFGEEERFSRSKHALRSGPVRAVRYCLQEVGISPNDLDVIAVGWDVPRVSKLYGFEWHDSDMSDWLKNNLGLEYSPGSQPKVVFVPHHTAHASVAFYGSSYQQAAIVVVDGNGDDESVSIFAADRTTGFKLHRKWPMSHSLGWMYEAASRFIGLHFLEGGKTMGLAAYGRAAGYEPWPLRSEKELLRPPFPVSADYHYDQIISAWGAIFETCAGREVNVPSGRLADDQAAVMTAWSAQSALEQNICELVNIARRETGIQSVCLSGGVALNCSANALIDDPLYVPPVPHDAGVALGAAWYVTPPVTENVLSPYLGQRPGMPASLPDNLRQTDLEISTVVTLLNEGAIGAIVDGRAEIGPRALCNRSILALPCPASMNPTVNHLKSRELWRPFGPVAFQSAASSLWAHTDNLARYMIGSVPVLNHGHTVLPAAVHVDDTTRPQEIEDDVTSTIAHILREIDDSGTSALINTSFNTRGQPIVNTATEAVEAFVAMDLDFLILGNTFLRKIR